MNIMITDEQFDKAFATLDFTDYRFKYLRHGLELIRTGYSEVFPQSVLNIQGESWILILSTDTLYVYGNNWTLSQLDELKLVFDLSRYSNFMMAGDTILVERLLSLYNIKNYEIDVHRVLYTTNTVKLFDDTEVVFDLAEKRNVKMISSMLQQYYKEEYHGSNNKSIRDMNERVKSSLAQKSMYVLKSVNNLLLGFCTVINPDVGILFINEKFRNKGYGRILLSKCTDIILKNNKSAYVMTVKSNPASNLVCKQVGFNAYYEHSSIKLNYKR